MKIDVDALKQFGNPDVLGCVDCEMLVALEEVPIIQREPSKGHVAAVTAAMNPGCVKAGYPLRSCYAVRQWDAQCACKHGSQQYGLGKAARRYAAKAVERSTTVGVPT